jgi:hypothetical protein
MAPFLKTAAKIVTVLGLFAFLAVSTMDPVDDFTCTFNTSVTAGLVGLAGDDDGYSPKVKGPDSVDASATEADVLDSPPAAPFHDSPILNHPPRYIVASGTGRAPPVNS